jgi:hypothetical protein
MGLAKVTIGEVTGEGIWQGVELAGVFHAMRGQALCSTCCILPALNMYLIGSARMRKMNCSAISIPYHLMTFECMASSRSDKFSTLDGSMDMRRGISHRQGHFPLG